MEWYTTLNELALTDIVLFDPITRKGREAMKQLGLSSSDVTPDYFYAKLRVGTNFEKPYVAENNALELDQEEFYISELKHNEARDRFLDFEKRMTSDLPNQSLLILLGVGGNGKSIEVNRMVDNIHKFNVNAPATNKEIIDFDDYSSKRAMTFVRRYKNPFPKKTQWEFCFKILKTTMEYIYHKKDLCSTIESNYIKHVKKTTRFDQRYTDLMTAIGVYGTGESDDIEPVFEKLIELAGGDKPDFSEAQTCTSQLFTALMLIMYCTNTNSKNYILIDNIESRIYLNDSNVQVLDNDIVSIYHAIKEASEEVIDVFNTVIGKNLKEEDYGWKKFKIILAMRRTSVRLLDENVLQQRSQLKVNIADLTGHFFLSDIWNMKQVFWNNRLKDKFEAIDPDANKKMALADLVFTEEPGIKGTSYQRLIARLMSHGIRRNARAQAHAVLDMYGKLHLNTGYTISYEEFETLRDGNLETLGHQAQYMIRRALIETQFKWAISDIQSRSRWRQLGIGNLECYNSRPEGEVIRVRKNNRTKQDFVLVEYIDDRNVTLMRRILSVLSYTPDYSNRDGMGSGVDLFLNISFYELIKEVMPGLTNITNDDYKKLIPISRVLISLGNMSNRETKGAPFVILNINDPRFAKRMTERQLARLLTEIMTAGELESDIYGRYNYNDYGIRLTDAGYAFLMTWQTSFSFMASLYCYAIPSLFYLKSVRKIKSVIETVYLSAEKLCKMYEDEAVSFCENGNIEVSLFYSGKYLPEKNGKKVTFRERVKEQHMEHLSLYKGYIKGYHSRIGISDESARSIVRIVDENLRKYKKWKIDTENSPVCF